MGPAGSVPLPGTAPADGDPDGCPRRTGPLPAACPSAGSAPGPWPAAPPVLEGLGQVVVRAAVQTPDPVATIAAGRQHQHRHRLDARPARAAAAGKSRPAPAAWRPAAPDRKCPLTGVVQPGHAVIADVHGVAPPVQQLRQPVRQTLFILHDQKPHATPPLPPDLPAAIQI